MWRAEAVWEPQIELVPKKWGKNPSVLSRILVNGKAYHHLKRSVGAASRPVLIPMYSYQVMLVGNVILDGWFRTSYLKKWLVSVLCANEYQTILFTLFYKTIISPTAFPYWNVSLIELTEIKHFTFDPFKCLTHWRSQTWNLEFLAHIYDSLSSRHFSSEF